MKISDCHNDFLTSILNRREKIEYIKNLKNVKVLCCAVYTTEKNLNIKDINRYKDELYILQTYTKTKLLFTIEDIGFIKSKEDLKSIIKLRPFSVTLCWNYKNNLCSGALDEGGITPFGEYVVKELEQNNIIIDTAHMNKESFYDFLKITSRPIFNSHTNIFSLHKHKRNLNNHQIQQIINSNGFMGLSIYQYFISNKEISSIDIANQINYLIINFGYKNIGFGTDFYGINILPKDINNYYDFKKIKKYLLNYGYTNKIVKETI